MIAEPTQLQIPHAVVAIEHVAGDGTWRATVMITSSYDADGVTSHRDFNAAEYIDAVGAAMKYVAQVQLQISDAEDAHS